MYFLQKKVCLSQRESNLETGQSNVLFTPCQEPASLEFHPLIGFPTWDCQCSKGSTLEYHLEALNSVLEILSHR